MHRGYVKLWRKSCESAIWKNHDLFRFWIWCLMKASHKKITEHINFQNIELEPGQFIFGRIKSSQECGLSQQTVRTCLKSLRCSQNLTIKSTNKYSIITIINWDIYQVSDPETNQQSNRSVTSKQPASNQQVTTNKNDKNVKNDKKKRRESGKSNGIPEWIPKDLWADFKEFRIRIKAPLTDRAT
jgi:hypothetical protein